MTSGSCGSLGRRFPTLSPIAWWGVRACSSFVCGMVLKGLLQTPSEPAHSLHMYTRITIAVREGAHGNSPGCRSASAFFSSTSCSCASPWLLGVDLLASPHTTGTTEWSFVRFLVACATRHLLQKSMTHSAQWWVEGPSSQSVHVGGGADACGEEHKLHAVALASLTLVHLPQAHDVAALMGSATVAATVATARVPPASFTSSRSPNALSASPKFDPASSVQWPSVGRVAGLRGDRRDRV